MDPVTALAAMIEALTKLVTVIVEGQTPDQKKQIWDWYIADVARWRKAFKIDER